LVLAWIVLVHFGRKNIGALTGHVVFFAGTGSSAIPPWSSLNAVSGCRPGIEQHEKQPLLLDDATGRKRR
jgi:hypothetical protein